MLKLYKWLATGHLGFIKMFGHFNKLLCYLFWGKTNNRKENRNKRKEKYRKQKPSPPLRPQAQLTPTGPAREPPRLSSTPATTSSSVACMPTPATWPSHLALPWTPLRATTP